MSIKLGSPLFLLFLVFLVMKLTQTAPIADWSWWWVTAPLWIPLVLTVLIIGVVLFLVVILAICGVSTVKRKKFDPQEFFRNHR